MRAVALLSVLSAGALAHAAPKPSDPVRTFVRQTFRVATYRRVDADLNGDGRPEAFVYITDPDYCGTGGCSLVILSPERDKYRVVLHSTVTRLPIYLLSTSTRGWRDVAVTVSGGGIRPFTARLRFNGRRYPSNPTVPPAMPVKQPSAGVLIGE